jgi:hypothetical protein
MEKTMRGIISVLTSAAALVGVAGTLAAQKPAPKEPSARAIEPGRVCYSSDEEKTECRIFSRASFDSALAKKAVLGLQLGATGTKRDTIGVFVTRVTPNGPAEKAGIVEGDRIVSINGVDLRVNSADAGDDYASGLPSRRLTREVEKLSPGNVATLRVSSGGRIRDVQVTAGRASDFRESGFGFTIGSGDGFMRSFPRMNMESFNMPERFENIPGMRFEEMPKMRMEDMRKMEEMMPRLRERMQEMPMRLKEFNMAPMTMRLREGGTWTMGEPSRVRVMSPNGGIYIYRDSSGNLRRSKALTEKERAARAKAEKEKKETEKKH